MSDRSFSPYEKTQLARHGKTVSDVPTGMPIEYVTGVADFCGLEFEVNPSVLIPRVETEGLVELALEAISEKMAAEAPLKIHDVATGSGAVIISLAKHLEHSPTQVELSASDISDEALKTVEKNVQKLSQLPIKLDGSDLLSKISGTFDLITANLPYIPSGAVKKLDASVINYEPILALDGGDDGFTLIKKLIKQSVRKLSPSGTLILELDPSHTEQFFKEFENTFTITFFNDCFDRHRFARLDLKN